MMVEDIQAQLIELLQKLNNYYVEIGKLKENSNELKRRYLHAYVRLHPFAILESYVFTSDINCHMFLHS